MANVATQQPNGILFSEPTMFRNRIINGDMQIDQRNAGASKTISAAGVPVSHVVDRFVFQNTVTSGTMTVQQSTNAPAGYSGSVVITNGASVTASAAQNCRIWQTIEGLNMSDFDFGLSSASSVTLSFWVRSSVLGTYAGGLVNNDVNRSYVFTYTINTINTWEYKTITIPGDTAGTWLKTNGVGCYVMWDLGSGSNFNGTANTWQASYSQRTSGSINWALTNSATFHLTGIQLERGSLATPFEKRMYGTELALCQRYFQKTYNISTTPGTVTGVGAIQVNGQAASNYLSMQWNFPVSMRVTPSPITIYNPTTGGTGTLRSDAANVAANVSASGQSGISFQASNVAIGANTFNTIHATAEAEL